MRSAPSRPAFQSIPHEVSTSCHSIVTVARETTSAAVLAAIADFCPRTVDEHVATFAREAVAAALPPNIERARALLFAAAKLGRFCSSFGLELEPERCLHPSVVERFIVMGTPAMTSPTRRTLRSNLRYLTDKVVPGLQPAPVALSRERAKAPYSAAEIAAYLGLVDAQSTTIRRHRGGALVCLGAGAGLIGGELRRVRGSDVVSRSGGLVVEVKGRRPRTVPVLAAYHERLLGAAEHFGERRLLCAENPDRHNVTTPLISSLSGGVDLARLDTRRLRATWLATVAAHIGLRAFMDAAGITCSQRLGDVVARLEPSPEAVAVALLGSEH